MERNRTVIQDRKEKAERRWLSPLIAVLASVALLLALMAIRSLPGSASRPAEVDLITPAHHRFLMDPEADFISALEALNKRGMTDLVKTYSTDSSLRPIIDSLASALRQHMAGLPNDSLRAEALISFAFDSLKLEPILDQSGPDTYLPTLVLTNLRGSCVGLSMLLLALGERADLPLEGVLLPGHCFVRWRSDTYVRNIETLRKGLARTDSYYQRQFNLARHPWYDLKGLEPRRALAGLLFNLGNGYAALDRIEDALREFRACESLVPGFPDALGNQGVALLKQGKPTEANHMLRLALVGDPNAAPAWINLGRLYLERRQWDSAMVAYDWLASRYPEKNEYRRIRDDLRWKLPELYGTASIE